MDIESRGCITVRFHDELTDFLPWKRRHQSLQVSIAGHESIKDVIESLGVPHPEVGALFVNEVSVDFGYLVDSGDRIDVDGAISSPSAVLLRPPLDVVRFVLDTHLGRLAAYLRMLGFDSLYRNNYEDSELAQIAGFERRVLLTRDLGLLKRSVVTYGFFVRSTDPQEQLREVVQRYQLHGAIAPFQRCMRCNGLTVPVDKRDIIDQLEPKTRRYYDTFRQCQSCGRIYWAGSHYSRMQQVIAHALTNAPVKPDNRNTD